MTNFNEILVYKQIKGKNFIKSKVNFNSLLNLSKKCNGGIFDDLKIYMIISIKWHFDYLAKTSDGFDGNISPANSQNRLWPVAPSQRISRPAPVSSDWILLHYRAGCHNWYFRVGAICKNCKRFDTCRKK